MDDSDQDFVDLCSKLLKRVRKKPAEPRPPRKAERQPPSQAGEGDRRRRNNRKDGDSGSEVAGTQTVCAGAGHRAVSGGTGRDSGDAGSSAVPSSPSSSSPSSAAGPGAERGLAAKDKVLLRMQQFKRASPQKMVHRDKSRLTNQEHDRGPHPQESCSPGLQLDGDEALALRLQQELDREAAEAESVDLEDGGLFFCQICHRDLSHMSPDGRTQHLNRCLDESEESGPAPPRPPPPPGVPDCPICGKKFKSQKSRSAHLKRCSSDMGVSPAVLLQALQRQTEEAQNVPAASTLAQTGGTKRKGPSKPGLPARKKPRKKTDPLDEEAMVALALSTSLLDQEREKERGLRVEAAHTSLTPALKWRPDAGKGRGRKRRDDVPRPPPLLLVQDAEAALMRLQERVSALLLRTRPPSPPTPTRCPSSLSVWDGAAPLWQKSKLLNSDSTCLSDFYTPELREFITPWESTTTNAAPSSADIKPETSLRPVDEGTPVTGTRASILPSSSQAAASSPAPSTPGTGQLPVGSQALLDLMELAEDGMTLTQCGYASSGPDKDKQGFVVQEAEEQAGLCMSGFLPEAEHTLSEDTHSRARTKSDQPTADKERGSQRSVALTGLASDLSSMVNNPQLSDVQLQVDSGEVYFAHSFMVYARCPLLAEMVHESGFGVQEEGVPAAQRVLMSDVPGQAVFTLLQYLYTAHCSIPAALRPHVLELASRFDLQELQRLCNREEAATQGDDADHTDQDGNVNDQTDQAFMELLRSMWNEEDEGDERMDADGGKDEGRGSQEDRQTADVTSGEGEICEEQVNEKELEEIYEFAATQRKRGEEKDSIEEEEQEEGGEEVFPTLTESKRDLGKKTPKPNSQLEPDPSPDRSCRRLFSDSWGVYEEKDPSSSPSTSGPPKTHTPQSQKHRSFSKPSSELSGRTLLQSSPSVVDDFSTSPPPSTSSLPIPGLSPGQVGDWSGGGDEGTGVVEEDTPKKCLSLKRGSQGPRSVRVPVSPDSPRRKKEPELIVLSDSSEEMEVDVAALSSRSPLPRSPLAAQNLPSYTQIKPQSMAKPAEPIMENKVSSSLELSPSASSDQSHPGSNCDQSPVDCSAEVSWLIPSTPVHAGSQTRTSSTQTKSSMCRTQLFPKGDASSPSSVFSSPAPPLHNRLQTSSSAARAPAHTGPTGGSGPRGEPDETGPCSSSLDLSFSPKRTSRYDASKNREARAVPPHQPKLARPSGSTQDTPLHIQPKPYSSTPLHAELHQPPVLIATSPLHSSLDKRTSTSQGRGRTPPESPEKTEVASFHLSPLSDPSGPPSSSSHRGLRSSQRHSKSSSESPELECENKDTCNGGEREAVDQSFQQSFMDEPPIAFNDSWGLDACVETNPGCFSLRLEDSRGSNEREHSHGRRATAQSSSSPDCQSCGVVIDSSPSRAHSAQPSTSAQARTRPAFTPSPPRLNSSLLDSKIWGSWEEEDEAEALPLSQRVGLSAQLKTPASSRIKKRVSMVPITPMPHYSDMDTPELKNKLNRFGVRPLPKRQMILKLREIHQYTHQLLSSDSEEEAPGAGRAAQTKAPPSSSAAAGSRPASCAQRVKFKEPMAPAAASPLKHRGEEEGELLSASQGSNTSSTAASEESERSNPELCLSSDGDSDSDGGITASQAANRLQDRLQAVRSFILSDSVLYSQILQYQPLVLSQLQERLKAAGIRLGAAKLVDYLDSQCITFTTAKPGHPAPGRRRGKRTGKAAKAAGERGANRKKTAMI